VLLPSLAGYALYVYLHHHVGPSKANVVAYVNPVAALTIGVVLFREPFQWWELVGFALVVVGLTLLTGIEWRRKAALRLSDSVRTADAPNGPRGPMT
ncbi:MAG TPA: DMT family transporter, partial [Thermoplasmata archaeon]|nr:DMT family transporter [Thermoplasmata archaeon]